MLIIFFLFSIIIYTELDFYLHKSKKAKTLCIIADILVTFFPFWYFFINPNSGLYFGHGPGPILLSPIFIFGLILLKLSYDKKIS